MAKIPRNIGRQVIPSGRVGDVPVPFDIADTGAGIEAKGLQALGAGVSDLGNVLFEIKQRENKADDLLSSDNISVATQSAKDRFAQFKEDSPDPKTWSKGSAAIWDEAFTAASTQQFNDKNFGERVLFQFKAERQHGIAIAGIQAADATSKIAVKATANTLITAMARGDDVDDELLNHQAALKNELGDDDLVEIAMANTLALGEKLRSENAISNVHAAIEVASNPITGGDFTLAKDLAKNPDIPETQQTTLRNAIKAAETARRRKIDMEVKRLIDTTTSQTLGEYFRGELSVATLNSRQQQGLIKDGEFKFMMSGLIDVIPDNSDPVAAGNIRRSKTNFNIGAITRFEAEKAIAENYSKLDAEDRERVFSDLEDIEEKIIATAKSNAYGEGRGLMSERFVGLTGEDDLLRLLLKSTGLTEQEKRNINRQFTAEINNRDLYERAVDDRFREMRKEGISDPNKFRSESLRILLQYQRRKQLGLEELEELVVAEQQKIILRPVSELTASEARAELARRRANK